ncbi:MAG TPA: PKD domain-containing protein [Chitinophagaceae bacterium]|nr:PKD domain-containing protein [Chitinophagaceae bacterium]
MKPYCAFYKNGKVWCLLIALTFFQQSFSQSITYDTTFVGWNVRVTYNPAADSTEGIVFMPGVGEVGTNASLLQLYGPHYWLKHGWDGSVVLGNGVHYPILISIQQPVENSRPWALKPVIDAILKRYKIKRNALHFTAISQGCWVLNEFITYMPAANDYSYMKLVRSMVNVQGMNPADTYGASLPFAQKMGHWAARFKGSELGFEQVNDTRNINRIVSNMNDSLAESGNLIWTDFGSGGHSNFNDFYNPAQKNWTLSNPNVRASKNSVATIPIEGGQNIWQWMLRQGDTTLSTDAENPPPNKAPVANAGPDQAITLPVSSIRLDASGSTDPDGSIASYTWTKISGPSSFSILNPSQSATLVESLLQGVYKFELKVVDNGGLSDLDTVTITVNAAPNAPPVASAGADQEITLPVNQVTLNGSGTDPDDAVLTYQWTKISGPTQFNILTPDQAVTAVENLVTGKYEFELAVTDSQNVTTKDTVTVTVIGSEPENAPPVANAGADQEITLPVNQVTLTGTGTDPDDTVLTYQWARISGPTQFNILTPAQAVTTVENLIAGTYEFELAVTDSKNITTKDTVTVTVIEAAPANEPPVADAGADQQITLPVSQVTLAGSGTDRDDAVLTYQWTKISGPTQFNILTPALAVTVVENLVAGTYKFELAVTDGKNVTAKDTVTVTVIEAAPENVPPVANAGADQEITLPVNLVTLTGNGTDPDDAELTYKWTRISGPAQYNILTPALAATDVDDLVAGVYEFELAVTDSKNVTTRDTVTVTVLEAEAVNEPPVADAGADQQITLPVDSVTLTGGGTDPDDAVLTYQWTKISGPAQYNILTPTLDVTVVNNLVEGVYKFELAVTDSKNVTTKDTVTITVTVSGPANEPPVANAGADQQIHLPVNVITLTGSGTDPDDAVLTYQWTKISGPEQYNILTPTLDVTVVDNLVAGVYEFELAVTDGKNVTTKDTVTITVMEAANMPPSANAGTDQQITLPNNFITLTGSGTDPDDLSLTYQWTKISGPAQYNIVSPALPVTVINNLAQGTYEFELLVTDSKNATSRDTVRITVNPAPANGCIAKAGADQIIPRGQSFAVLDGSASVGSTYKWRRLTPVDFSFKANVKRSDSPKADVLIMPYTNGGYDFELLVTGPGCISKDTVNIRVDYGEAPPQSTDGPAGWHYATAADVSTIPTARIGDVIINGARSNAIENGKFSSIYIYPTSSFKLGPGRKILIKAGKYASINLNFGEGEVVGSGSNPIIITNYGGQVEAQNLTVTNAVNAKITGKYVPGVSGDVNYKGHAEGDYAFSRGTYGIYCNNNWSSLASVGLKINGQSTDSLEVEYLEIGNGNFAGVQIKQDEGTNDYDGFYIHDLYIHDIHGEGMYLGSTSSGQRHKLNGWLIQNVRIVNAGNEIFQMGNIGANTSIRNNVFINSATNWKSPFNLYQDNGIQLSFNNGNCEFRNNILLGGGTQTFNAYSGLRPDLPYNGDSLYINNNLIKYARGFIGGYWGSGTTPINGLVVKLDSNYFGGFQFAGNEVYNNTYAVNTGVLLRTVTNGTRYYLRNTVSDGSKPLTITGGNIDSSKTVIRNINNPQFVNSGWPADFNWNKLYEWSDFIFATWGDENVSTTNNVKWKTPVYFNQGDYVLFLSKVYKSKISSNHGHMPHGVTDEYWELQTWNDKGIIRPYPPDDYRLIDGDEYKKRDIGLTNSTAALPNQPPAVSAGQDITITLPVSSATLVGNASDPDGTIISYAWKKITGPTAFTIQTPAQAQTGISNLVEGAYTFELTVTDNKGAIARDTVKVTVRPAVTTNQPPIAVAGPNKVITLPVNTVTLNGSGTDAENSTLTFQWSFLSGPAQYSIVSPAQNETVVNNLVEGSYRFVLQVKDAQGLSAKDTVTVTVNAASTGNQPPVAYTGANRSITLPVNNVTVNGSGSYDADGSIATYQWIKIGGPAQYTIVSAGQMETAINNLVQGVYRFELTVTDNNGATGKDTMTITVNAALPPNEYPVAIAGTDRTITLPVNTVTINGSGSYDPDGTVISYQWTKISGPASFVITSSAQPQTSVNGLVQGVYQFELLVTDNQGAKSKDTVSITVLAPNKPPVANAGNNVTITLPTSSLTINGSSSYDPDGTIVAYRWTKIAGPAQYSISAPAQKQTQVGNLVQGVYKFELIVTDNQGALGKDTVTVTVNPGANQLPVANAGSNVVITLPVNSIIANGSGSYDPDGSISTYVWTKVSGPSQFTIAAPTQKQTGINNLVAGIYKFELKVTDNRGGAGKDTLTVTVKPAVTGEPNQLPFADAGGSQTITYPANTVVLDGSASYDPDGTIATYNWSMISGPAQAVFLAANAKKTEAAQLVPGEYKFKLTVTDNRGGKSEATVIIIVLPEESVAKLYPNPASNIVNVVIESNTQHNNTTLRIFDSFGKLVYQEQFVRDVQKMVHPIDISKLANGAYFINIAVDINHTKTLQFIKQ